MDREFFNLLKSVNSERIIAIGWQSWYLCNVKRKEERGKTREEREY